MANLPLLLRLDEDEAVENGEEEVENDEDDQIVVDQLQYRAPVTKFILRVYCQLSTHLG